MSPRPTPATPDRGALRPLAVGAAATALLLSTAPGAAAHVRVHADTTAAGGYAQLVFRVPTESDVAGTTGLRVELPTATPFTSVRTRPVPGWTAQVERGPLPEPVEVGGATLTEAPTAVVWTAQPGTQVAPGEYQEFAISVGPLPEAGTEVLLPATQTYADGEVVAWDEPTAGAEEPDSPAPVLTTTAAGDDGDDHAGEAEDAEGGATAASTPVQPLAADTAASASDGDPAARWLAGGGLALGAAALGVALVGRRTTRAGAA